MLVGERMSSPVIATGPNIPINEALNHMRAEHIRRLPVIDKGKLVGIVSDRDLLNASPSPVTSLSIWEMNYLLSQVTVSDVMTKDVISVTETTPIEEAARIMADHKIGGLPVLADEIVVGVITETDLFKIFIEMMGAREEGVRVTVLVPEKHGELAELTKAVSEIGGNFIAFGQFLGEDVSNRELTFKVADVTEEQIRQAIQPYVERIKDIRSCPE